MQDRTISTLGNLSRQTDADIEDIHNLSNMYVHIHIHLYYMTLEEIFQIINSGGGEIHNFTSSFVLTGILNFKQMYCLVNFFVPIYFLVW